MERYLIDKKEEIKELKVSPREVHFPETKNFIISIIGPRRAGKTYSLYNLIKTKKLRDEDYLLVNFEDDEIKSKSREEITKAIFYHQEIYGKEPSFVLFDEIQSLKNWESFIYSLYEKKRYFIFITGSSSKLLSKEIATQLRGRSITTLILPFSFREIISLNKIDLQLVSSYSESRIKNILQNYLKDGGFPDVVLTNINRKVYFRDYLNVVVFRDIIERYNIKNVSLIKFIISSLISSFSKEFSTNKLFNALKSKGIKVSKKSLYKYEEAVFDSFLCFSLNKFSFSERELLLSIPKVYVNDPAIVNYNISTRFSEEVGRLMENVVFLELKRKEYSGEISQIFYFKDYQQREVDFVVKNKQRVEQLIQVSYAGNKDEIEKREIKSLIKASELLKCKNLLCITWGYEDEEKIEGKKIKFIPLWKWLLNPNAMQKIS